MRIGTKEWKENKTYVMGILNVTPDSFSDVGKYSSISAAIERAKKMEAEGAHIIDVGGESTRPGHVPVSAQEEMQRVIPVVEALKKELSVPVSVDTTKSEVAKEAILAGADLINDVNFCSDNEMLSVVVKGGASYCLTHNSKIHFCEVPMQIPKALQEKAAQLEQGGMQKDKILLDPGIGFAGSTENDIWILQNLELFAELGYPVLLGTSRKSVIGKTLDLPVEERLEGTLATTARAFFAGCRFVRVHDVKENVRCLNMLEAMRK